MTLEQRIRAPDPKTILTMDGGGVLGMISVEIRARIEGMLRSLALMYAAKNEQDSLCRAFGKCQTGLPLDREVGDVIGKAGPSRPKLFTYTRYDPDVTQAGLDAPGRADINAADVQAMDSVEHPGQLQKLGRPVAESDVRAEHCAAFLASP